MVSWCRHTHFRFENPLNFSCKPHSSRAEYVNWMAHHFSQHRNENRVVYKATAFSSTCIFCIHKQYSIPWRLPHIFFFFVIFLFAFRFILFSTAHKKVTAAESGKMYKIVMRNHVHVIRRHNCRTSRRFEGNTSGENEYAGDQHKSQFRTETLFRNNERVGGPWNISWPS